MSTIDTLIEDLAKEAKRYTHAVSAKDRDRRLAHAAVAFVTDLATATGTKSPHALKLDLLTWIDAHLAQRKSP